MSKTQSEKPWNYTGEGPSGVARITQHIDYEKLNLLKKYIEPDGESSDSDEYQSSSDERVSSEEEVIEVKQELISDQNQKGSFSDGEQIVSSPEYDHSSSHIEWSVRPVVSESDTESNNGSNEGTTLFSSIFDAMDDASSSEDSSGYIDIEQDYSISYHRKARKRKFITAGRNNRKWNDSEILSKVDECLREGSLPVHFLDAEDIPIHLMEHDYYKKPVIHETSGISKGQVKRMRTRYNPVIARRITEDQVNFTKKKAKKKYKQYKPQKNPEKKKESENIGIRKKRRYRKKEEELVLRRDAEFHVELERMRRREFRLAKDYLRTAMEEPNEKIALNTIIIKATKLIAKLESKGIALKKALERQEETHEYLTARLGSFLPSSSVGNAKKLAENQLRRLKKKVKTRLRKKK